MELNEKLAKWAGFFSFSHNPNMFDFGVAPDGRISSANFTTSLDACFKWLVPKLEPLGYDLEISNDAEMTGWRISLHNRNSGCSHASLHEDFNTPSEVALALCKAIERMINREELNDIE